MLRVLFISMILAGCEFVSTDEQRKEVEVFAARHIPVGASLVEITKYGLKGSGGSRYSYPYGTEYIYNFRDRCYLVHASGGHAGLKTLEVNCKST